MLWLKALGSLFGEVIFRGGERNVFSRKTGVIFYLEIR